MKVITDNGVFNITKDLYESIKKNNPEILMEKAFDKDDKDYFIKIAEKMAGVKINKNKARAAFTKENIKDEFKLCKDIIEKAAVNGSEIVKTISPNMFEKAVTATDDEIRIAKQQNNSDNENNDENNKENKEQETDSKKDNKRNDGEVSLENDFINDPAFKKEVINSEELALALVKYIKNVVRQRLGLVGSDLQANKSFQKEDDIRKLEDEAQKKAQNDPNNQPEEQPNNQTPDNSNKKEYQLQAKGHNVRNKYQQSSAWDRFKAFSKLSAAGFMFAPIKNNKEDIGIALRFLSDIKDFSKTKISQMLQIEYDIKGNITDHIVEYNNNDKAKIKEFDGIVKNYLQNVCYRLTINNESEFNNVIQVMRYDPKLRSNFKISEKNDIRVMNAKRTIMLFVDNNYNNPALLLIIEPLLPVAREFTKSFNPLMNAIKKHIR